MGVANLIRAIRMKHSLAVELGKSLIFIFEKSLSKSKHAFRPKDATVDAHMLSLSTWAWRRLCDVLSARESRDGMGYPPPLAGPLGRRRFFRRFSEHFCVTLEHLFFKRQNVEEKSAENLRAKICAKICAPKICAKICAAKICAKMGAKKSAQKSAHQNGLNIPFPGRWKPEKKDKKHLRQICAKPQPQANLANRICKLKTLRSANCNLER